jgi:DNA polymerase/3'-5' exonuclease PolX
MGMGDLRLTACASMMLLCARASRPNFAATNPYDAAQYQPYSSASYLDTTPTADAHATFIDQPTEDDAAEAHLSSASSAPTRKVSTAVNPLAAALGRSDSSWLDQHKAQLACQLFSSSATNLNAHLTGPLEKLESMNQSLGDSWRTYAYRKAVGILKKLPHRVSTDADAFALASIRGLGDKMLAKIVELLRTGRLQKAIDMESNSMIQAITLFSKIHGVGAVTARKWHDMGARTIEDVLDDRRIKLTPVQKVGLQFMEDKTKRIPRLEVTAILEYVHRIAESLLPGVTVICCGSYRRGAPNSGDVDLLFTHHTFTMKDMSSPAADATSAMQREGFLKQLLEVLHAPLVEGDDRYRLEKAWTAAKYARIKQECDQIKQEMAAAKVKAEPSGAASAAPEKDAASVTAPSAACASSTHAHLLQPGSKKSFLTGDLTTFDKLSAISHGSAVFMGFCLLPAFHPFHSGVHRRLDIKVYPSSQFPFALLYFTGSDHFNRSMRFYAKTKMWTLSDHGLSPAIRVNRSASQARGRSAHIRVYVVR